jgi:hypothetical protein
MNPTDIHHLFTYRKGSLGPFLTEDSGAKIGAGIKFMEKLSREVQA